MTLELPLGLPFGSRGSKSWVICCFFPRPSSWSWTGKGTAETPMVPRKDADTTGRGLTYYCVVPDSVKDLEQPPGQSLEVILHIN